ncbi:MAG: TolC family protein [Alistipes sp.]|nr:TolC family protein [Candidatus Minthomonas equi]
MIKKLVFSFILVSVMVHIPLRAQETGVYRLTLRDAQEYALQHNRTVMNSSLAIRQAEADKWQAIASMLPQLTATGTYNNMFDFTIDFGQKFVMPSVIQYGGTASLAISAAQIISTQISNLSKSISDITLRQTEQEVVEQVKTLYFSALVAQETIELLQQNLESLNKLYKFSAKAVEVGTAEKLDADQILVQVATMENSISSSQRSLEVIYNSLRLALCLDSDREIELIQTLDDVLDIEKAMFLLNDDFLLDNNFSWQLMQKSVEISKKQYVMAGWNYAPTLSGFYQYSGKKYLSDAMRLDMTPPHTLGLTLTIPIFSSGANNAKRRSARMAYETQLNNLSDTELSLRLLHRQCKYNLTSAFERYQTQKKSVDVSQGVFDNITKKYQYGMSSALDVTNASTSLINAQTNYVTVALDFVNAQIELEKLLNKNILDK